jgi:hypothetical protein
MEPDFIDVPLVYDEPTDSAQELLRNNPVISASTSGSGTGSLLRPSRASRKSEQRAFCESDDMLLISFWEDRYDEYVKSSKLSFASKAASHLNE